MTLTARPTNSARLKEALEIRKLRTDILFVKLTFLAQVVNTIGITALGVLVFFYFQRPQLEQMEATRLTSEKLQVGQALERAILIENPIYRAVTFKMLKELWPQYSAISVSEETRNLLDAKLPPVVAKEQCGQAQRNITALQAGRALLEAELDAEVRGTGTAGKGGFGPIAQTLKRQLSDLIAKINQAQKESSICAVPP